MRKYESDFQTLIYNKLINNKFHLVNNTNSKIFNFLLFLKLFFNNTVRSFFANNTLSLKHMFFF